MNTSLVVTVALCALLTIAIRALPIVFLAGATLPRFILNALSFVPSGIMIAIVTLELVGKSGQEGGILAAAVCALVATLVAIFTRSLFATVLVGVGCYLLWFVVL